MRLRDKVALVTGAGSGIGAATARRFAAEGAKVALFDLRREPVERIAAELGGIAIGGDAAATADAEGAVAATVERFGGIDTLVTCAGADVGGGALGELSREEWDTGIRANMRTCMACTRAALPALVERRGSVVVISSVGALQGAVQTVAYQTAKAALLGIVRSVAVDYGPQGVRINAVCPGFVLTPMAEALMERISEMEGTTPDRTLSRSTSVVPMQRAADPDEIAKVCVFLGSEESSYVTGSMVIVHGGATALNSGTVAFADAG